jgi:hypothetical protein
VVVPEAELLRDALTQILKSLCIPSGPMVKHSFPEPALERDKSKLAAFGLFSGRVEGIGTLIHCHAKDKIQVRLGG